MDGDTGTLQGVDQAALAQIAPALQGVIDAGDLSGFVTLIWRKGQELQFNALGHRDIEAGKPMTRDTLFRIASMTKPVTSVAALMLMEEGKLKLDDPISQWMPEFKHMQVLKNAEGPVEDTYPAPREITVEDLFTHRAGLAYGFTSIGPIAYAYQKALGDVLASDMGADAWLAALAKLPLSYPPGERFHYSHATDVLGFLVGRVAGMDFRDFLFRRIFEPLGMVDTAFHTPPEKAARRATLYRWSPSRKTLLEAPNILGTEHDKPPRVANGGGGLVSTLSDYAKFAQMLLNGGEFGGQRIVSAAALKQQMTNHLPEEMLETRYGVGAQQIRPGFGYGFNGAVFTDPAKAGVPVGKGTYHWDGAAGTWFWVDPLNDLLYVALIQLLSESAPPLQKTTQTMMANAFI